MAVPQYNGVTMPVLTVAPDEAHEVELLVEDRTIVKEALDLSEERLQTRPRPLYGLRYRATTLSARETASLRKTFELAQALPFCCPIWPHRTMLTSDAPIGTNLLYVDTMVGTMAGAANYVMLWSGFDRWEVLACAQITADIMIELTEATTLDWSAGTTAAPVFVIPLLIGAVKRPAAGALTDELASIPIEFIETFHLPAVRLEIPLVEIDPEITYSGCKDEITVAFGEIPGAENVAIYHSDAAQGPWEFWGETRQAESEVVLGNYFGGRWVRVVVQRAADQVPVAIFQADSPNVLPPTFTVETHHLGDTDFAPTGLSLYPLIYQAVSSLDAARAIGAVYSGNLTDPDTGRVSYTVPLFSDAFVEVGPRYAQQILPGGNADNTQVRITLASEQEGVELRLTKDGSDPTLLNGDDTVLTINPIQDTPRPRAVVICRAFKDGCQSPPVYLLVDIEREATQQTTTRIKVGDGEGTCFCASFVNGETEPGSGICSQVPWGLQPDYCSLEQESPCTPPSDPELIDVAILQACEGVAVNDGGLVMQSVNITEAFHWDTGPDKHYYGPKNEDCPGIPWGGGQWRVQVTTRYLVGFTYNWQADYTDTPAGDLYLAGAEATINGVPSQVLPTPGQEARPTIEGLTGVNGASTNDMETKLLDAIPGTIKMCPGDGGHSGTLELVNITQSCCNN